MPFGQIFIMVELKPLAGRHQLRMTLLPSRDHWLRPIIHAFWTTFSTWPNTQLDPLGDGGAND